MKYQVVINVDTEAQALCLSGTLRKYMANPGIAPWVVAAALRPASAIVAVVVPDASGFDVPIHNVMNN